MLFKDKKPIAQIVICLLLAACALLSTIPKAHAKTVGYGSDIQQVRIKFGSPTVFRFPKSVQTVTGASRLEVKPQIRLIRVTPCSLSRLVSLTE